jgi:CBS domain-containing protein
MKTARDLMTTNVFTVSPDTDLTTLARLFTEKDVGGFPVVDADGKLAGVVTESDLIHRDERLHIPTMVTLFDSVLMLGSSKKLEEEIQRMVATKVGEIMTKAPLTLRPETTLAEIATLMGDKGVHTLPVVDGAGRLVGIVGKRDLIRSMVK